MPEISWRLQILRNSLQSPSPIYLGLLASVQKLTGRWGDGGIYGQIPDYLNPPKAVVFIPVVTGQITAVSKRNLPKGIWGMGIIRPASKCRR